MHQLALAIDGLPAQARVAERRRAKIWFVNKYFWPDISATGQILSDLAFHLADSGHEVGVITSSGCYHDDTADLGAFQRYRGVDIYRVKRPRFSRRGLAGRAYDCASMYVRFAAALAKRAKRGDVVVVKTDPPLLSCAIAPVAAALGLNQVNWLQDLYPEVALELNVRALKPMAPLLLALRDWSLKRSAINVGIGERMALRLRARGVREETIAVIPNWCDDSAIQHKNAEGNDLRRAWGLEGKFVVGYSGNLGRAHECETLLAAAERLRGREDVKFLFIGGGRLAEELKEKVQARGLGAAFCFQPYQPADALPLSLGVADTHWLSLRPEMEGLIVPSKFYGIAAAGRPTIAVVDAKGELGALIARHRCGMVVEPGDGEGFARAILTMRDDEAGRAQMGRNARRLIDQKLRRSAAFERWDQCMALALSEEPAVSGARVALAGAVAP